MIVLTRRQALGAGLALTATSVLPRLARAATPVRLTSVKFGSVSWLIDTMRAEGIDKKHGLDLEVVEVANNPAAPIALLSGSADVIVSDWTWALRQRARGDDLKFAPYSAALGSLMVPKDSPIKSFADLVGKKIGVAGTGIDKSWILLRAYSRKVIGKDIANVADPVFGAAPLVSAEFKSGRLDAVLNFWTYAARLRADGAREVLSMADVVKGLGVSPTPALVGFIWSEKAVADRSVPVDVLLSAVADANAVLAKSDAAWERLRPLIKPASDAELVAIRDYYRSGITGAWGPAETSAAEKLTNLLIELGDAELVGDGTRFDQNLFHT
ncbi:MAG: ABC transporter substrate-binding protein [Hyphomicrobium sp.]|uniref:ABC transporter substrate-binding protein n=1 Tax=Hyphomicrobium sp. TaxID=82 RepID=UPI0035636932